MTKTGSRISRGRADCGMIPGMTAKKITISIPEDVAEQLAGVSNVSAYVTEAIRTVRQRETFREMMARHGVTVTDAGVARGHALLEERRALRDSRRARSAAQPERSA